MAAQHAEKQAEAYAQDHNKKATEHIYKENDLVLMKTFDLKNKNRKMAEKWQGNQNFGPRNIGN